MSFLRKSLSLRTWGLVHWHDRGTRAQIETARNTRALVRQHGPLPTDGASGGRMWVGTPEQHEARRAAIAGPAQARRNAKWERQRRRRLRLRRFVLRHELVAVELVERALGGDES